MKTVILAGGLGTRIIEESVHKPKPMIEIGGMPILWHLMKFYSHYGFIICLGYKKDYIFEYFDNLSNYKSSEPIIFEKQISKSYFSNEDNWKITLVDTGLKTMTAGRLNRIKSLIGDETFLLTYGDTLSNIDIEELVKFHKKTEAVATLTSIQPRSKYGIITFDEDANMVKEFEEKPIEKNKWINGGFYVIEPEIFNFTINDATSLEIDLISQLVNQKKLAAFKHHGFWKSIETYKDKLETNGLWQSGNSSWKIWRED